MHGVNRFVAIDCDHTQGLTRRDGAILFIGPCEEVVLLALKPVFVGAGCGYGPRVSPARPL
jgi:hypothetical protein